MGDLFYGGEIGSVTASSGGVYEYTGSGKFDATRARCAILVSSSGSYAQSPTFAGQSDIWFHWRASISQPIISGTATHFAALGGATAQARLTVTRSGSALAEMTLEYLSGETWVSVGTYTTVHEALSTFDLHINKTTGVLQLYAEGALVIDVSGLSLSGLASFTACRWYGHIAAAAYFSELCVSTSSTVGMAIISRYPNGDGANTAWTGTYADVDEIVYNDADAISTAAADQLETFTHTGGSLTGLVIRGVGVTARAKKGATGPTSLKGVIRIGSTDYLSTATEALGLGYGAHGFVWETSPATSSAFTESEITQFGVKSIA